MSAGQPRARDAGACRLAGAVARLTESWPDRISPGEIELPEKYLKTASEALSLAAHETVRAEGAEMTLEQAIDYALRRTTNRHALQRPAGLSPRELEVAALVARGLTNREIA